MLRSYVESIQNFIFMTWIMVKIIFNEFNDCVHPATRLTPYVSSIISISDMLMSILCLKRHLCCLEVLSTISLSDISTVYIYDHKNVFLTHHVKPDYQFQFFNKQLLHLFIIFISFITQRFGCAKNLRAMRHDVNVENPWKNSLGETKIDRQSFLRWLFSDNRINSRFYKLPIRRKHPGTPGIGDFGSKFVAQLLSLDVYCR